MNDNKLYINFSYDREEKYWHCEAGRASINGLNFYFVGNSETKEELKQKLLEYINKEMEERNSFYLEMIRSIQKNNYIEKSWNF